ncbi:hypothetical protein W97_01328 [Coniosporium apollinis CBS 100218]|uniref:Uncharacterized protein n=1 Tax=Coniosporium apollinis (strain CBS 100218) TaxID=1168221 RepID=R7YJZ1_CONA1|nr:uncharacterized protein W97_01328 [Coniosporium apollinis CBS 100218]EON62109.1 hypothetical protein W97_01328 [Coniosporium apollinis CBS 100218]
MSSTSGESDASANQTVRGSPEPPRDGSVLDVERQSNEATNTPSIEDIVAEEQQHVAEEAAIRADGRTFDGYGKVKNIDRAEEDSDTTSLLKLPASPGESISTPDDSPSIQGSVLSSPGSSVPASQVSYFHRPRHPASLQPFERRFSSRLSPSPLQSPRALSPAFLTPHSRTSSISSQLLPAPDEADTPQPPWEVVRWTKLKKITGQALSEAGKRNFGRPTCLVVAASIAIGTSKGFILVFDYQQTLKSIIGPGTKAVECGSITSLALSADHSTVAGGHANGHIFTWELSRPAKPFLHILPLDREQLSNRKADGHVTDAAILHVGFLGTRHTALVSADDGGMAFSHLATRGLGAVARSVNTTRILGRYPPSAISDERPRKPSSVLAFAPLPLGNVEQPTDSMGLTALLTPYLLVVVSTTPIAQTQHKASRPKEIAPHSTLSGCLAWFPAVKLKNAAGNAQQSTSRTKLVYCWSNVLTILDVDAEEKEEKETPPNLHFRPRSRWRCEEAIVAIQWLSRSVLGVLTISQRLMILEDTSLRMTDSFDLLHKHIFHQDLFSRQLQPVVEQLDEEDVSMHGVVADAFHMSFRAYKGRLFLLGFNEVSVGTLSNWADRLLALMEEGDYIAAIGLATSYYNGDADKLTVGLPDDHNARHALVHEKLMDMISASLRYTFRRTQGASHGDLTTKQLVELTAVTFTACLSMEETDFLFDDVYEAYKEASSEGLFLGALEPYITGGEVTAVPPNVLKDLITYYAAKGRTSLLEEMVCRLDTQTMDIDQVTTLCKRYNLYDALIYVWQQAIKDYITPLIELLSLVKTINQDEEDGDALESQHLPSAMKLFTYLAYALTGRIYPSGASLPERDATDAKAELYGFLLSGKVVEWPQGSGHIFRTRLDKGPEPSLPYLRLILNFDTGSLMSMFNEAFEDSFLNGNQDASTNGVAPKEHRDGLRLSPTRQYILNILIGLASSDTLEPEDVIYIYMFVARSLPKYPQYIILPGSVLHRVLEGLCNYPLEELAEDCQLSVEYLLSVYHPSDLGSLIPLFQKAGFHRVLKSVFRGAKEYAKLLEAYFNDLSDRDAVFDCIGDILRPNRGLNKRQIADVQSVIVRHAKDLAAVNSVRTAQILVTYAPDLLEPVLNGLEDGSQAQFMILRTLLEPSIQDPAADGQAIERLELGFRDRYVLLMCRYDPTHVADYVSLLRSGDLNLSQVLPAMETSGVVDAAVILMARDGLVQDAMDRLVKHLRTLETALTGLLNAAAESPDTANTEEAAEDLLDAVQKYVRVGVWLCQGQTNSVGQFKAPETEPLRPVDKSESDLTLDELLWLDLIDTVVTVTKNVSTAAGDIDTRSAQSPVDIRKVINSLRGSVQQTFTALLAATSAESKAKTSPSIPTLKSSARHPTFLRILRAFLTRASRSSPSLSDLRSVLASIFSAYTFEETILSLANQFLDKDLFGQVSEAHALRQRGWRPRGQRRNPGRRGDWKEGAERQPGGLREARDEQSLVRLGLQTEAEILQVMVKELTSRVEAQ